MYIISAIEYMDMCTTCNHSEMGPNARSPPRSGSQVDYICDTFIESNNLSISGKG